MTTLVSVGLFALLATFVLRRNVKGAIADLENPGFRTMPFEALPPRMIKKFARMREELLAMGFRELTTYEVAPSRRTTYCVLLRSGTGDVVVELWAARLRGLGLIGPALSGYRAFKREILMSPRYAFITYFPETRRVETTPVELLKQAEVLGDEEYVIVSESTSFGDALGLHSEGVRKFIAKTGQNPLLIRTEEDALREQRAQSVKVAMKLRKQMEG